MPISPLESWLRRDLKLKCLDLTSVEHTIARQHLRLVWLKEGNASTKFFHIQAKARRQKNCITCLRDGDKLVVSHDELHELASTHFCSVMGMCIERDLCLDLHSLGLRAIDLAGLDNIFSEDEV